MSARSTRPEFRVYLIVREGTSTTSVLLPKVDASGFRNGNPSSGDIAGMKAIANATQCDVEVRETETDRLANIIFPDA